MSDIAKFSGEIYEKFSAGHAIARFLSYLYENNRTMKKACFLFTILVVATLTSCHRPVAPRFELLALDTLLGDGTYDCRVEYRFATIANASKSAALQTIQRHNIDYFFELEAFEGTAEEAAAESLRQLDRQLRLPEPVSAGRMECEVSVESEGTKTDSLLTYAIYRSSYLGGAHGMYTTEYHTYSLTTGRELTAADLFGPQRMEPLAALIRAKLYERYRATDDDGLAAAGFFPEYISATDNFRFAPGQVVFCYNPYEIGCYALGNIEVAIDCDTLLAL